MGPRSQGSPLDLRVEPRFLLGVPQQGCPSPQRDFPRWAAPHFHHTAQCAHHVSHISMGLMPAAATTSGVQKGTKSLPPGPSLQLLAAFFL